MKRYDKYKNSVFPFQRKIPLHWTETTLYRAYRLKSIANNIGEELLSVFLNKGVVSYSSTEQKQVHKPSEDLSKYQLVEPGDFVLNNQQAWRGSVGISKYRGIISPAYYIWKPRNNYNSDFMNYMVRDKDVVNQFVIASKGVGSIQRQIYVPYMKTTVLAIPPREEQDQIVRYLDWKISKINHLIQGYQKQIALLKEHKTVIIDTALTKGINSNIPSKKTKAEWMGEVPTHWNVCRMKNLFEEINVRSKDGTEPHLTMSQKKGLITDDEVTERRLVSESYKGGKICEKDDLVLNRLKAHLGVFALAPQLGVISPDYTVLRLKKDYIIPRYAEYLLKSNACRRELCIRVRGIVEGFWRLYTDDLGTIPVSIPDTDEQHIILDYILDVELQHNKAIGDIEEEIELLREYRTRLISDIVTGQIDVRDEVITNYSPEDDTNSNYEISNAEESEVSSSADKFERERL